MEGNLGYHIRLKRKCVTTIVATVYRQSIFAIEIILFLRDL